MDFSAFLSVCNFSVPLADYHKVARSRAQLFLSPLQSGLVLVAIVVFGWAMLYL